MVDRVIKAFDEVSPGVRKERTVNLDKQSMANELGTIPDAVKPYVTVTEYGDSLAHRTVLTCVGLPISVADDAGVAQYGGVKVYTFPEGLIFSKGAMISGNLTMGDTGTFINAFTGVNALGSATASTGSTLTGTEATWLQSTANATASSKVAAVSSVSIATALTEASSRIVNGTSTPAEVYLNFAIADDASHTAGTGHFDGTITISWEKIGDL